MEKINNKYVDEKIKERRWRFGVFEVEVHDYSIYDFFCRGVFVDTMANGDDWATAKLTELETQNMRCKYNDIVATQRFLDLTESWGDGCGNPLNLIDHMPKLKEIYAKQPALYESLDKIMDEWFRTVEELLEHLDSIRHYADSFDMEGVAFDKVEEGELGDLEEYLKQFINYSTLGESLYTNGNFLVTEHGVFEYIG